MGQGTCDICHAGTGYVHCDKCSLFVCVNCYEYLNEQKVCKRCSPHDVQEIQERRKDRVIKDAAPAGCFAGCSPLFWILTVSIGLLFSFLGFIRAESIIGGILFFVVPILIVAFVWAAYSKSVRKEFSDFEGSTVKFRPRRRTDRQGNIVCPICWSSQLQAFKRGFSGWKALGGAVAAGPLGLLGGLHGAGKVKIVCMKCGHEWDPGK